MPATCPIILLPSVQLPSSIGTRCDVDGKKVVALPASNTISKLLFKKKPKEDH